MIRQFVNGICMALADSVPGVSGGTIAFILGFYDAFIGSIHDVFYGRGEVRKSAVVYLLKLGVGWICGMAAAVLVLSSAFESHIYFVSSLFLGLVIASVPVVVMQEWDSFATHQRNVGVALIGAAVVCAITWFGRNSFVSGVQLDRLTVPLAIYIFIAGMVAISAMFLPGISGSTLLLIFGLYLPVIAAIKEFLHLNLAVFPGLCTFGLGVIAGALSVVKLIKSCLDLHRSGTMYAILGMMVGSLYAIVMGPTSLETPAPALSFHNFNIPAFVLGIGIVAALQFAGTRKAVATQK